MSDYYLQTDHDEIHKKADILFNYILTEFDEPLYNDKILAVTEKYTRNAGGTEYWIPNVGAEANTLDADIKETVFPFLAVIATIRSMRIQTSILPSSLQAAYRYKKIIYRTDRDIWAKKSLT